jgi:hypothetical protein
MSSMKACALLVVLLARPLFGQDWEAFAASSTRASDSLILQVMAAGALEEKIALCRGLARRADQDLHSIIESLAAAHVASTSVTTEVLLRYLLEGVRDAHPQEKSLRDWYAANSSAVDLLLVRMPQWKSQQLKGDLLAFAVIAPGPQGLPAITDVGVSVVEELAASADGLVPSEDGALALNFLAAARQTARSDYFSYCADIARLSRDKVIVDAARAAAAALARAP